MELNAEQPMVLHLIPRPDGKKIGDYPSSLPPLPLLLFCLLFLPFTPFINFCIPTPSHFLFTFVILFSDKGQSAGARKYSATPLYSISPPISPLPSPVFPTLFICSFCSFTPSSPPLSSSSSLHYPHLAPLFAFLLAYYSDCSR